MKEPIKVLIVDDSALVRQALKDILSSDPLIEVIDTAPDPLIAARKISKQTPDVIMLDVEMPRMDGLTFLRRLMSQQPLPVVICSSLTEKGADTTLRALQYGAVEVITKPRMGVRKFFEEAKVVICDTVKAAASAKLTKTFDEPLQPAPKLTADAILHAPTLGERIQATEKVVVIGASTGGTEALRVFLQGLPQDCPGLVIVQHMPEKFTAAFARRLNQVCPMHVKEAVSGDVVGPGRALIAPGNQHILLKRNGSQYFVELKEGPLVSRHRPSVDVLFRSAARYAGANAIGVIMTGMGDDGAKGMKEMKEAGATNIAQDEGSSIVFGMPKEAIKLKAVDSVLPLSEISSAVLEKCLR